MWLFLILAILVILAMIMRSPSGYTRPLNKTVWLLWLQGWDNPPYLIDKVRQTWVRNNPGWNVQLVSKDNLSEFIDVSKVPWKASPAAQSDVIRIHLLEKYGGIWADATLACVNPIDSWLDPNFKSIWMYRGSLLFTEGKGPASWFIIARQGSYSVRRWKEKVDEYWSTREETSNYFWLDGLWWDLYRNDTEFAQEWDSFESPSVGLPDGPAMMDGKVNGISNEVQKQFLKSLPNVVKLSHRDYDEIIQETNGNLVLRKSLGQL